jgi:two-component system chemotaxis response regulator CheY
VAKIALVVDDSMVVRKLVSKTLNSIGFETVEAPNGREALELAKKHADLAIIITDQNMPVMTGIEFIRALRAETGHRFTPVVFLTTESGDGTREEAREAGATAWIVKPFNPEKVVSVVQRIAA